MIEIAVEPDSQRILEITRATIKQATQVEDSIQDVEYQQQSDNPDKC